LGVDGPHRVGQTMDFPRFIDTIGNPRFGFRIVSEMGPLGPAIQGLQCPGPPGNPEPM